MDEDALAAKIAADTIAASDAAKRKIEARKRKLQKLEMAKRIAAETVARQNAQRMLMKKADAKRKAAASASAKTPVLAAKAGATKDASKQNVATPSAASTAPEDQMSPTAAIPPLDLAHPSPGTPLPPLPAIARPAEVEEKKQEPEEGDAVLDHALAAAAVAETGNNTAGGQQTQELCAASALAVASAAADAESRGKSSGQMPKKRGNVTQRKKKRAGSFKPAATLDKSSASDAQSNREKGTKSPRMKKMRKMTAKETIAAEALIGKTKDVFDFDSVDEEDPVEHQTKSAQPRHRTVAPKGHDKKRPPSKSEGVDTSNGKDAGTERPKKRGRGRPRKYPRPAERDGVGEKNPAEATVDAGRKSGDNTTAVAEGRSTSRGGRTRGGEGSTAAARLARAKAGTKVVRKDKNKTAEGIPDGEKAHNLFMSREGKNAYFRVELLIGPPDNRVRMVPFSEVLCEDGDLSIDSYVATEGQPFALRVKIARPRSDNAVYGGRVYIDKPCSCKHHDRTEKLGEHHVCGKANAVVKQLNEGMDHFFWIGPGETEYMIEGFYKNQAKSQQFVFAKPEQKLDLAAGVEGDQELQQERLMSIWRSIGGIRIAFSLLKKWKKRPPNRNFDPEQAAIDAEAHIERKGKELSAQPGDIVEDRVPETDREAVLSNNIVFEKRIDYNTFCGYKASHAMMKFTNTIGLYKGLPVDILKQLDVRKQCVNMYMTQVPLDLMRDKFHDNLEETFKQTHSAAGQSSSEGATSGAAAAAAVAGSANGGGPNLFSTPDKWVPVRAIVRAICRDLSPAGSYLICTGEYHVDEETGVRNYGETVVQNTEASNEEKYSEMDYKTEQLAHFFTKDPHIYDSRDCGTDADGNIRYEVCAAVVDLTADSDDEFRKSK